MNEYGYNKKYRKESAIMRPRSLNFEQLVDMNRQELLNDEKSISQIEEKLEKKQEAFLLAYKKNKDELTAE